jgi:integral membrane protein
LKSRPVFAVTIMDLFRKVAFWEGISFLVLLLIAMPLKYVWGYPLAVRIVGTLHGILFLVYLAVLLSVSGTLGGKRVFIAFLAAVIPFGTFWLESKLRTREWNPEIR